MPWSGLAVAAVAFILMEPVTAATHRWIMHGIGKALHRSHHRQRRADDPRWETNDWYPIIFGSIVNIGFLVAFNVDGFTGLIPIGIGTTMYGLAYGLMHDVYIHERLGWFRNRRIAIFSRLAEAHRIHHLYGGAPYGMLIPIVPAELRDRARRVDRKPFIGA